MAYKCEFHAEVENDFIEAYAWYEEQKAGLGERFLAFVRQKISYEKASPKKISQIIG